MENFFLSTTDSGNENHMTARCKKASLVLGTLPENQNQSQKDADDDFDVSSLFIS